MSNNKKNVVARFTPGEDGKITGTLRRREAIFERYGVGCVSKGSEGRKESNGPIVPGPWAYVFRLCTVIASGGHGSGTESKDALELGTEQFFSHGDIIEIDGVEYVTLRANNDNTHLEPVPEPEPVQTDPMRLSDALEALRNGLTIRQIGRNEYEVVGSLESASREERLELKPGPMKEIETDQFKPESGRM